MPAGKIVRYKSAKRSVDNKQNKEIKVLKRQVKILNKEQELKFLDDNINHVITSVGGAIGAYQYDLLAMNAWDSGAAGANALRNSEREGNKIVVKKASIKGSIYLSVDQGATLDYNYDTKVRMLIVLSPDSGYPLLDQVLESPSNMFSHNKIKPENPYKILYDRSFNLQSPMQVRGAATTGVNTVSTEPWRLPINIKLGKKAFGKDGLTCTWQQGSTTIHPQQGAVTVFIMSTALDTQFKPQISARSRVRFIDN